MIDWGTVVTVVFEVDGPTDSAVKFYIGVDNDSADAITVPAGGKLRTYEHLFRGMEWSGGSTVSVASYRFE